MKNTVIATIALLMLFLLCGCADDQVESEIEAPSFETITINQLASVESHVTENIFDNLTIDAGVKILVNNNFNTYYAKDIGYNFKNAKNAEIVLTKGKTVIQKDMQDYGLAAKTKDGTVFSIAYPPFGQSGLSLTTKTVSDRKLSFAYLNYSGESTNELIRDRETLLAKKELDFMSSEDACKLVHEKLQALGFEIGYYEVYTADYDYLKNFKSENYLEPLKYTKEDEMYIIVPRISLPNESIIAEITYTFSDLYFRSGANYAVVNKDGIIDLFLMGNFNVFADNPVKPNEIISLTEAIKIFKSLYPSVSQHDDITVYSIELSYFPFITNKTQYFFEMRPAWIFFTKRYNSEFDYTNNGVNIIDAITGKVLNAF